MRPGLASAPWYTRTPLTKSTPPKRPVPSDRSLEDTIALLASRQDHVGVIRLFEAWNAQGEPTNAGRLAAAHAFHALRMMDRALSRLREVLETEPQHPEALRLQALVYLDRGWPQRARPVLATLRAAGVDVDDLAERAQAEPARPDHDARAIEREGDPARMLGLAEQFLATGSFVRAKGILERLRRQDPDHARVRDLLWGISGESADADRPLAELVAELAPLGPLRRLELPEEPEHTESVTKADARRLVDALDEEPVDASRFPTLFKYGAEAAAGGDDLGEHTVASRLAGRAELAAAATAEHTDARLAAEEARDGDTRILHVLRPGEDVGGRAHRRKDDAPSGDAPRDLDLEQYREAMGMTAPPAAADLAEEPARADDILEEEDENLVVLTRAEAAAPGPVEDLARPIEVIERHPQPPPRLDDDAPTRIIRNPELPPEPPPAEPPRRGLLVGGFAALAVAALVIAAILMLQAAFPRSRVSSDLRRSLVEALATVDQDRLLAEEVQLEPRSASSPDARLTLAEARLVLWNEYNGDPARLAYVTDTLGGDTGIDPHRRAVLEGALALALARPAAADPLLTDLEPRDDEDRVVLARWRAARGESDRALGVLEGADRVDTPRIALERATLLAALGQVDEAGTVLKGLRGAVPDHAMVRVAEATLAAGAPDEVLRRLDRVLAEVPPGKLPPRAEAGLHARRARLLASLGRVDAARAAVEAGLGRDGTHPALLWLRAADAAGKGENLDALGALDRLVAHRPGDDAAQRARVLTLLELDRVAEAEASLGSFAAAGVGADTQAILVALVTVAGRSEAPAAPLTAAQRADPLGAWVDALWAVQARRDDALAAAADAESRLKESPDPFLRRLVPRAAALQALAGPEPDAAAAATRALAAGATDPMVHVLLGRYHELGGRRLKAALHFDRAAELGGEVALAAYEKGRFYQDAADGTARARSAWSSYLDLAPTGPRADRVRGQLR